MGSLELGLSLRRQKKKCNVFSLCSIYNDIHANNNQSIFVSMEIFKICWLSEISWISSLLCHVFRFNINWNHHKQILASAKIFY
jgi:hypothetical protein